MIKEEWKPLKESSNYLVSNTGKIKSLNVNKKDGGIEMKHNIGDTGYHRVVISIKDKCKLIFVHKAVAEAFLSNPETLPTVDHIDRNKDNNNVENLRWASHSTQIENRDIDYSKIKYNHKKGGKNVNAKKVICLTTNEIFNSLTEASYKYDISIANISACCKGKIKSAKGFVWEYWKDSDVDD